MQTGPEPVIGHVSKKFGAVRFMLVRCAVMVLLAVTGVGRTWIGGQIYLAHGFLDSARCDLLSGSQQGHIAIETFACGKPCLVTRRDSASFGSGRYSDQLGGLSEDPAATRMLVGGQSQWQPLVPALSRRLSGRGKGPLRWSRAAW
jgi:hypothetical protein